MTPPQNVSAPDLDGPQAVEGFQKRIMVVEDDPGLMGLYRILLHARGYRVLGVEDGEEALRTFADEQSAIDLMIVDLGLPKLGGFEMLARLRASGWHPRVLVCSGVIRAEVEEQLRDAGAIRFIAKPFRNREMLDEIDSILAA